MTDTGLDRVALRKIKEAAGVIFRFDHILGASIECIAPDESRWTLELPGSINGSGMTSGILPDDAPKKFRTAFEYIQSARFSRSWVTTTAMLKAGDRLTVSFNADYHTNQYAGDAGLHVDVLMLHVDRGEGRKTQRFTFHVASRVTPNNSARMVQE
jgi:hypothetical protein